MSIRLGSTVINCADMELMTSFWSQALNHDYVVMTDPEGNEFCVCAVADR